jgi:hypothetical protein
MRRRLASLVVSLLMAMGGLALGAAPAAQALPGTWQQTTCWPYSPVYGAYNSTYYIANAFVGTERDGTDTVFGQSLGWVYVPTQIYNYWAAHNWECGSIGIPFTKYYNYFSGTPGQSYIFQYFIVPYSCSLHYIIAYSSGTVIDGAYTNYYCTGP